MSNALDFLYLLFIWPIETSMDAILAISTAITGSIGFSAIILSLAVNCLLIPLSSIAEKWQHQEKLTQQKLAPFVEEIKAVFTGQERFMMLETLYKQHHYHPLLAIKASAGLLLQIPFFFAAYQLLNNYAPLQEQSFLFIPDLSAPDSSFMVAGISIHILPILMTAINIASAYVYSAHLPSKERKKQYALAIIFLVLLYSSPSALVLYWTVSNCFSLTRNLLRRYVFKTAIVIPVEIQSNAKPPIRQRLRYFFSIELNAIQSLQVFTLTTSITFGLIFFFIPTSVYLSDPTSFNVSFNIIAQSLAVYFLATVLPLTLFFSILPLCLKRFFCLVSTSIALSSGLYALVLTGDYGALDFFQFQRNASIISFSNLIKDTFIFFALYYLSFKLLKENTKHKFLAGSSTVVATILFATLINVFQIWKINQTEASTSKNSDEPPHYAQDLLSFNPNGNNVLVIMLDMFTGGHIEKIFKENPDIRESLDGFTWYPNTISAGTATFQGEPGIHGGHHYTPYEVNQRNVNSLLEEINKGYSVITEAFGPKGYDIAFAGIEYADCKTLKKFTGQYPPNVCTEREYEADFLNYWLTHSNTKNLNVNNEDQASMLATIGLFRVSSYNLRPIIYQNGRWLINLSESKKMTLNGFISAKKSAAIESFQHLSNSDNNKDTFKYIQSSITHYSWAHAKDSCEILSTDPYPKTEGVLGQVNGIIPEHFYAEVCALRALGKWFNWMKKEGVYNNTQIILVSDHGQGDSASLNDAFQQYQQTNYPGRAHALLLTKEKDSKGSLRINPTLMSNADTPFIFCQSIGGCKNISGNYGKQGGDRVLHYAVGDWRPSDHEKGRYIGDFYRIKNNIFDPENWEKTNEK